MDNSKFTLKTQYVENIVNFILKFDVPLSRKELKDLKDIFFKPSDPNKEKLTQYKNAIDKFILNRNQFSRMLQKSDLEYRKLPFKSNDKAYGNYLDNKESIIKDYYDEYTVKKELQKMDPLTGLTDSEKKKITRDLLYDYRGIKIKLGPIKK